MTTRSIALVILMLIAPQAFAWTPAQVRSIYANCVNLMRKSPKQREVAAKKAGELANLPALEEHCNRYLKNGLPLDLKLEKEYDDWEHGRGRFSGGGGGFGGSLDCLSNEHYVDGACEPKSLVRCDGGADCAFGESCTDGVCH